jgi:hypothetical protein
MRFAEIERAAAALRGCGLLEEISTAITADGSANRSS